MSSDFQSSRAFIPPLSPSRPTSFDYFLNDQLGRSADALRQEQPRFVVSDFGLDKGHHSSNSDTATLSGEESHGLDSQLMTHEPASCTQAFYPSQQVQQYSRLATTPAALAAAVTAISAPVTSASVSAMAGEPFLKQPRPAVKAKTNKVKAGNSKKASIKRKPKLNDFPSEVIRELLKEQEVKRERLARKAELARMSRKRKKEKANLLEDRLAKLQAELNSLKQQRDEDQRKITDLNQQVSKFETEQAAASLQAQAVEEGLNSIPAVAFGKIAKQEQNLLEKLSAVSGCKPLAELRDEDVESDVHGLLAVLAQKNTNSTAQLEFMHDSIAPCMPLRFLHWAVNQNDKFYANSSSLWNTLLRNEIGMSEDQMGQLLLLRSSLDQHKLAANKVEDMYKSLSDVLGQYKLMCDKNLTQLKEFMTPKQLAKFLVWVEHNQLCVKMLESVAPTE